MPFVLTKTGQIQEKISDKYKSSFKDKNVLKTQIWERENSNKEGEILILAIDPGTFESAYVIMGEDLKPIEFGKVENKKLLTLIQNIKDKPYQVDHLAMKWLQTMVCSR